MAPPEDNDRDEREDEDEVEGESEPEVAADEPVAVAEPEAVEAEPVRAKASSPPSERQDIAIIRALKQIDRVIGTAELAILVALVLFLITIGSYNALRDLAGEKTSLTLNELFKYTVFAIAMTGAAMAAQRNSMISMDIVSHLARPRTRLAISIFTNLFAAAMTLILTYRAHDVTRAVRNDVPYDKIPPATGVWILPIGLGLITFHLALHAIINSVYFARGELPPEDGEIKVH